MLISRHADGEYIARTVERLGMRTIRGSTTRGGARALLEIVRVLREGGDVAITPDGPKGPRMRVQPGCVLAASRSGAAIVPIALECRRSRRLRSWDRFVVPAPFTRVEVLFGAPLEVPGELDEAGVERWRETVERALLDLTARAAHRLGRAPETPAEDPLSVG